MKALQYIYTSWKNGDSTEKGYMIYSRSEGISDDECGAIKDAMQYLAPKELSLTPTPQEILDIFPYAFSYFILPSGRGCVAQSTYLGKDYSGRYGNYIIYALVFEISELPCRPAELFAEPYIKTFMTEEELDASSPVPPLPAVMISSYASVINDDQLMEFLYDKEDEFSQLLAMILSAQDLGVPFYLNDTRENLVLWAAATQRVLPFQIATRFMFNTYVGNHEFMRSQKAKDEGLNFHLIGVRPDANFFNYATECKSNRQVVMDFLGGHMTQGITPNAFTEAMASSITLDYEEIDDFGSFIETTTFNDINGHLQDAYLYYCLLRDDDFDFSEESLKTVIAFGEYYCQETDNSSIGSKLLVRSQEENWVLKAEILLLFWKFVCKYASFMKFTLYELLTNSVFRLAEGAQEACANLDRLLYTLAEETPEEYKDYLQHLNTANDVNGLRYLLTENPNLYTNYFYINWLLRSYSFSNGLHQSEDDISKLLSVLLKNIAVIDGCEKQMMEILIYSATNQKLFVDILGIFSNTLTNSSQLDKICTTYIKVAQTVTNRQRTDFEQMLLEVPEVSSVAERLFAYRIIISGKTEEEFWQFYNSHYNRMKANDNFDLSPIILACLNAIDSKNKIRLAIDILRNVDISLIKNEQIVRMLTDFVNDCTVKELIKMEGKSLQTIYKIRSQCMTSRLDKIKVVHIGRVLKSYNLQGKQITNSSEKWARFDISLAFLNKMDYDSYIKSFFDDYFALVETSEDIPNFMAVFYNSDYFSNFIDELISTLKTMQKRDIERWCYILAWICAYLLTADTKNQIAEELHRPIVRYLKTLNLEKVMAIRHILEQNISSILCDSLFEEVERKEGITEKLGGFFYKR